MALGWTVFPEVLYQQQEQPLQFSHQIHSGDEVGMACDDCHRMDVGNRYAIIPPVATCAECHAEPIGDSLNEQILVEEYILKEREIPWLIYAKQPDHVRFSHPTHVELAELSCERCHGPHGSSDVLPPYEQNRLTGYSRLIWGHSIARIGRMPWEGKKMDDCSDCHREAGVAESCMDCHK